MLYLIPVYVAGFALIAAAIPIMIHDLREQPDQE